MTIAGKTATVSWISGATSGTATYTIPSNESSIEEIKAIIEKEERERYRKMTPYGSTEVILLGITKLDDEEKLND